MELLSIFLLPLFRPRTAVKKLPSHKGSREKNRRATKGVVDTESLKTSRACAIVTLDIEP